jgi:hypothetical protein
MIIKRLNIDMSNDKKRREEVITITVSDRDDSDEWRVLVQTSSPANAFNCLWEYLDSQDCAVKTTATFSQQF